jgi:hypothetical protein
MTTAKLADCCVVRAPLSRHDSSDQGTRPVSLAMVTLRRAGPGAEVVDEFVALRSCVHAWTERRPKREVESLGSIRSDCILIVELYDLFLARLSCWTLKPQEAQKLWSWHDETAGFVRHASARVRCFSRCLLHRLVCIPLPGKSQESRDFPWIIDLSS